ncbi:hypothetical protein CAC42_7784 [Sphaceloma murrayae]|uniref:PEBP-like protein n=1 Tax=Sphaceloma murrayae TaxID=2082308 RepID=A0A2K1QXQ4_9PEZI|nr:hypothetical protein CAC42_7784 [Sphaceloma murrayae]
MYVRNLATALLLCASRAIAQTPDDSDPDTDNRLEVTYGNTPINPGTEYPQPLTLQQPRVNTRQAAPGPYMLVMLDLSLPRDRVGPGEVADGIGDDRTTRLHWLQTNLTVGVQGVLTTSGTPAVADYAPPQPPQGDIPHIYTWYLFTQPASFQVPAAIAGGQLRSPSVAQRNNFSLSPITGQAGVELREANFFLVQNPNNTNAVRTAPGFTPNATAPTAPAGTASGTGVRPPVASFTGAASKLVAALPAVGAGAFAMLLL